eukprot:7481304-Pyramimonas_sp.AAC.1
MGWWGFAKRQQCVCSCGRTVLDPRWTMEFHRVPMYFRRLDADPRKHLDDFVKHCRPDALQQVSPPIVTILRRRVKGGPETWGQQHAAW